MRRYIFPVLAGIIIIITGASFFPALKNGFTNWDDSVYLIDNTLARELSIKNVVRIFTNLNKAVYEPLTLITFNIEHHFFGLDPFIYHLNNLLLHLLNTLLVFAMIYSLSKKNLLAAFITSILFGIHPLRVESVAWITERKDVLYAFFYLLAMLSYIACLIKTHWKKYYVLSILFFILSVLSKPAAVSLPMVLFLIDYMNGKKIDLKNLLFKLPFILIMILSSILCFWVKLGAQVTQKESLVGMRLNPLFYTDSIIFYVKKVLWPMDLCAYYKLSHKPGYLLGGSFPLSPILVILYIGGMIWAFKKSRDIFFGAAFFLLSLLPVISLTPFADRYTYVPYLGLFYLWAHGIVGIYESLLRKKAFILRITVLFLATFMIGTLSLMTQARCGIWKDSSTLWTDTLKKHPDLAMAYKNRGVHYLDNKQYDKAIEDFNELIRLDPKDANGFNNRGISYLYTGRTDLAIEDFDRALSMDGTNKKIYLNRAAYYDAKGLHPKAIVDYSKAIMLDPEYARAYSNRAVQLSKIGRFDEALKDFNKAIDLDINCAPAYYGRAMINSMRQHYKDGLKDALTAQKLGHPVNQGFLQKLKEASDKKDA